MLATIAREAAERFIVSPKSVLKTTRGCRVPIPHDGFAKNICKFYDNPLHGETIAGLPSAAHLVAAAAARAPGVFSCNAITLVQAPLASSNADLYVSANGDM
ncbi:hypothetical protein [Yoonia sp.]|uniref:hypothetical protein n=1 Tax=Yoonia sp. TaxID=2212373 RepID=UPI00391DC3CD